MTRHPRQLLRSPRNIFHIPLRLSPHHTTKMVAESFLEVLLHNWPAVLTVSFTAYLISNRFNRGLNQYPGPVFASLTNWWRFWDVYTRRPEVTHIKLHEKHGDVVRLGPNVLSISDPKALKIIYGLNKGFTKVQSKYSRT